MYEFTQDCLTGIDQIDEEHRKLFSLINEAVELPKEARTPQTVKNILEHLSDYAVNHFCTRRSLCGGTERSGTAVAEKRASGICRSRKNFWKSSHSPGRMHRRCSMRF